jgi:hypothetical protein
MTIQQFLAADEEQQVQAFWNGTSLVNVKRRVFNYLLPGRLLLSRI